jgi:hypothetical protein
MNSGTGVRFSARTLLDYWQAVAVVCNISSMPELEPPTPRLVSTARPPPSGLGEDLYWRSRCYPPFSVDAPPADVGPWAAIKEMS